MEKELTRFLQKKIYFHVPVDIFLKKEKSENRYSLKGKEFLL